MILSGKWTFMVGLVGVYLGDLKSGVQYLYWSDVMYSIYMRRRSRSCNEGYCRGKPMAISVEK